MTPFSVPTVEQDAEARRQAIDPARSFILQAPAGSGKTSVLVQRFLACLTTVKKPEQVLAITFTRKAAGEMQARIFEALNAVARGPKPEEEFRCTTYDLAVRVLARSEEQGWDLIQHPARLQILTIDALCRRIVEASPISSGLGSAPEITDSVDTLIAESLRRLSLTMAPPPSSRQDPEQVRDAYAAVLSHIGGSLDRLNQLLREMLLVRDRWHRDLHSIRRTGDRSGREAAIDALTKRMTEALWAVIDPELQAAREILVHAGIANCFPLPESVANNLRGNPAAANPWRQYDLGKIQREQVTENTNRDPEAFRAIRALSDWLLCGKVSDPPHNREIRRNADHNMRILARTRGGTGPDFDKVREQLGDVLESLRKTPEAQLALYRAALLPDPELTPSQKAVLHAILVLLEAAESHLQAIFAERNLCDFTELALRAVRALGEEWELTEVAERFDASFRHILVDEFQDTSHSQVALLGGLTKAWDGPDRSLFLVGDPMQSIYLFRQADVSLFLDAWNSARLNNVPLQCLSLSVNFRSDRGIVDLVNEAFDRILPSSDNLVTGSVSRRLALSHHGAGPDQVLRTNLATDQNGNLYLTAPEVEFVVEQARIALAAAPERAHEGEIRSPVAVLVRAKHHALPIIEGLARAGIGVTPIEIDSLVDRPVVRDLVQLTAAIANPGDRIAWTALLHGPAVGLTYADLALLAGTASTDHLPPDPTAVEGEQSTRQVPVPPTRMALWNLVCHSPRRQLLSESGRRRLERALPTLERAVSQWGRRPAALLVEGAWIALGLPGCYPDLDSTSIDREAALVFETIARFESEGEPITTEALMLRLADVKPPTPLESRDRVTICTIHKAKGLEWDTVILPAMDRFNRPETAPLLTYETVTVNGEVQPIICPLSDRNQKEQDALARFLQDLKRRRLEAELGRLLYVAMTRARRRLVLTARSPQASNRTFLNLLGNTAALAPVIQKAHDQPDLPSSANSPPCSRKGALPSLDLPPPPLLKKEQFQDATADENPQADERKVQDILDNYVQRCKQWLQQRQEQWVQLTKDPGLSVRHIGDSWERPGLSPRVWVRPLLQRPDRTAREQLVDIRRSVLSGQVLIPGRAYHRIMEALARLAAAGNLPGPDQARMGGTLENLVRRALSLEGVAPSGPDETMPFLDRLLSIVHKSLSDPALRWTLDQPGQCEVGIEGIVNGEYVLSRVDRTFVATATGTRYIVDYKVVSHEGGGLERFLLERARGYSGQLEGYAKLAGALGKASKSVRLALYFAAQGIWAVWTPGGEMNLLPPGVREL